MNKLIRTDSKHPDFVKLVNLLDQDLAIRDGDEHAFYHQFNGIESLQNCVVMFDEFKAIACGAFKPFDKTSVELKRMFTLPDHRGKGIASQLLKELEIWAAELGFKKCLLETGKRQHEAIALYEKNNYSIVENFEPYVGVENSVCFSKSIA